MAKIQILLVFIVTMSAVSAITMFNFKSLTKQNGAMCMDGSPYGIYIYEPDPNDFKVIANKVLIYWEWVPFGWCYKTNTSASIE